MTTTDPTTDDTRDLLAAVLDPAHRADPYPFYARLREQPVQHAADGTYVISRYADVSALLQDPRISVDPANSAAFESVDESFIHLDPPEHDRLRRSVTRQFGPGLVNGLTGTVRRTVTELLDRTVGQRRIDVVGELAYPLPVAVICEILGIPREDENRFHVWADTIVRNADPASSKTDEENRRIGTASDELAGYLGELTARRRAEPGDDLLSRLIAGTDDHPGLTDDEMLHTARLLLIAGHETTVNLLANSTLALLRHPDVLARLRADPGLIDTFVEEMLRYDAPVQFRARSTRADIDVAGTVVPAGSSVLLVLASANRDPARFTDADRPIPDRQPNEHLGFGGGMHYCVGAPLARMEVRIALTEVFARMVTPRLAEDPPPYRTGAGLRGPERLLVDVETIR